MGPAIVRDIFTNNVAIGKCDNCKDPEDGRLEAPTIKGDRTIDKVSNLVNKPKLNEKYTDAWFLQQNPQYWNNLRTMESL